MKKLFLVLLFIPVLAFAEPMYSPTWGFHIDLPEGYDYIDGDLKDRFSFSGPEGLMFDLVVYDGRYNSLLELANDINRRLSNQGEVDFFQYRDKQAAIISLVFGDYIGWGLAVELGDRLPSGYTPAKRPVLLALAYGPANKRELEIFNLSALDSISPTLAERRYPGPIMEYSYPRGEASNTLLSNGLSVIIRENDAEASQVLIEREFAIMRAYLNTSYLYDACIRYYRFIYRDSWDRITNAASVIANNLGGFNANTDEQKRAFAQRTLNYVQGFSYERDMSGSDFLNLMTAAIEGRGDCDNRAMLFAIILAHAGIRGSMMLSFHYSHAMGLADIAGSGARFEALGTHWLVAETTANIDIGLIDQELADIRQWFAIVFE